MTLAFLLALGVRIIDVADLGHRGVYVQSARVLLIDSALDDAERNATLDQAIGRIRLSR